MRRDEPSLRQSIRLSLRTLSCNERKIVILTAFVLTFCDIRLTASATVLDPRQPKMYLSSFLASLSRFENSQNVKMTQSARGNRSSTITEQSQVSAKFR